MMMRLEDHQRKILLIKGSKKIISDRQEAAARLQKKAKRMKITSDTIHEQIEVGNNVKIPFPTLDKTRNDLRNIGVVLEVKDEDLYKIGTRDGVINKLYSRYIN